MILSSVPRMAVAVSILTASLRADDSASSSRLDDVVRALVHKSVGRISVRMAG